MRGGWAGWRDGLPWRGVATHHLQLQGQLQGLRRQLGRGEALAATVDGRAAVHRQGLPAQRLRAAAGQEEQRLRHFGGRGHAAQRDLADGRVGLQPAGLDQPVHQFSAHEARRQHRHAPLGMCACQGLGLGDEAGLAGAVGTTPGDGLQAGAGRHIDHPRAGLQQHAAGIDHGSGRCEVERQQAAHLRGALLGQRGVRRVGHAGVVDDRVQRGRALGQRGDLPCVGQVDGAQHMRGAGQRGQGGADLLQGCGVVVDQHALPACAGEQPRRVAADAGRCTSDQNRLHSAARVRCSSR